MRWSRPTKRTTLTPPSAGAGAPSEFDARRSSRWSPSPLPSPPRCSPPPWCLLVRSPRTRRRLRSRTAPSPPLEAPPSRAAAVPRARRGRGGRAAARDRGSGRDHCRGSAAAQGARLGSGVWDGARASAGLGEPRTGAPAQGRTSAPRPNPRAHRTASNATTTHADLRAPSFLCAPRTTPDLPPATDPPSRRPPPPAPGHSRPRPPPQPRCSPRSPASASRCTRRPRARAATR